MNVIILNDQARDAAIKAWIGIITSGGRVVSVDHVSGSAFRSSARAVIDGGNETEIFLKIDLSSGSRIDYDLAREQEILRRLGGTPVLAPRLLSFHAGLKVMAMECVRGTAQYDAIGDDSGLRDTVDRSFVAALAGVHRIDVAALKLDHLPHGLTTGQAIAADLRAWRSLLFKNVAVPDDVTLFAFAWLAARKPTQERKAVLVQGDPGPGNFLFNNEGVTGLVDWEMAHIGHPLEDLGAVLARSLIQPMMSADRLLQLYELASGTRFGRDELIYATVLLMTRFNVPILIALENHTTTLDYGLTISFLRLSQISMLTLIAEAEGIIVDDMPGPVSNAPSIRLELDYLSAMLRALIRPRLSDDHGRYHLDGGIALIDYLKRVTGKPSQVPEEPTAARFATFARAVATGTKAMAAPLRRLLGEALHREQLMGEILGPRKGNRVRI
jgi:aminoglycoside phosphotransferase (APT) family kinase protein